MQQAILLPNPGKERTPPLDPADIDSCAEHLGAASLRLRLFKLRLGSSNTKNARASLIRIDKELRLIQRLARQINNLCAAELAHYPEVKAQQQPTVNPATLYTTVIDVRRHTSTD